MKKKLFIVVGAGGTGSYFIPNLYNYLNSAKYDSDVAIVDGDVVEEKNLLRQGFYAHDLDKHKSTAIYDRLIENEKEYVTLYNYPKFINNVDDVFNIVTELSENNVNKYSEINLISCVDNNMARLRLTFAVYMLQDVYGITTRFLDSGNNEWNGQTLGINLEKSKNKNVMKGLYDVIKEFQNELHLFERESSHKLDKKIVDKFLSFQFQNIDDKNSHQSIFVGMGEDWKSSLNKGDFEMSCEDVVVSNPQNIGTNMTASSLLLLRLSNIHRNEFDGENIYMFNAELNTFQNTKYRFTNSDTDTRYQQLLEYAKSPLGFAELFTDKIVLEKDQHLYPSSFNSILESTNDVEEVEEDEEVKEEVEEEFELADIFSSVSENEDTEIEITLDDDEEEKEIFTDDVFESKQEQSDEDEDEDFWNDLFENL